MTGEQAVLDRTEAAGQHRIAAGDRLVPLRVYLFALRDNTGFDGMDAMIFAVYATVLAVAIHHHIAWADEAQAWLIARDSSLREMLQRRLHYEGAPALWPLVLWIAIRLHMPYGAIGWLSAAFALPGIYLLLRYSPFPRIFRWLLPSTFFLQYQYAVIARPYALYPVLIFTLCTLYTSERRRPILFALTAGVLANVSLHGAVFACLFIAACLRDLRYGPRHTAASRPSARRIVIAGGVFCLLLSLSALVAFPAPDVAFAVRKTTSAGSTHALLLLLMPEEQRPAATPPLDPPLRDPVTHLSEDSPPPSDPIVTHVAAVILSRFFLCLNAAAYPIAESNLIALAFFGLWMRWLWSRRMQHFAFGWFAGIFLCTQVWVYGHHTGLFALVILATVWITLKTAPISRGPFWLQPVFAAIALAVVLLQIGWTVHCIRAEATHPYDPGLATERFLTANYPGRRIAGFTFETVSTQPYSPANLYLNWPHAYFSWANNIIVTKRRTEAAAMHPDVVVYGDYIVGDEDIVDQWMELNKVGKHPYQEMLDFWQAHGYVETHRFCGDRFARMDSSNRLCDIILEPASGARRCSRLSC